MTDSRFPGPRGTRPPAPFDDLVDDNLRPEERAELARVDALLRAVPPPPELPPRLAEPRREPEPFHRLLTPRRGLAAVALAAALAAVAFGLGAWVAGDRFTEEATVAMAPTFEAPRASAVIRVGEADAVGNRVLRFQATGLEELPPGGYYLLWIEQDGEYAGPCGTFAVGPDGEAEVAWTVSYDLEGLDAWVVSARIPGQERDEAPRILEAPVEF